jgi:uncharacterized protein (TIGR02145 family)
LLVFVIFTKGQEIQQMKVHKNGNILYNTKLSTTDAIFFSAFKVPNSSTGVLINGVVWACCNVDTPGTFASHPSASGMLYQWNRCVGWSSTDPLVNHEGGTTWDDSVPTGDTWEEDPCPKGWRLPTIEEFQTLIDAGSIWTSKNGVIGRRFGDADNSIFLPAAGFRLTANGPISIEGQGYYWSSSARQSMDFTSSYAAQSINTGSSQNYHYCVRCIAE